MLEFHDTFINFVNFFSGLIYLFFFKIGLDHLSEKKYSNVFVYSTLLLFSILIYYCDFEAPIIFAFACLLFYKLNYKVRILRCIIISFIYWLFMYITMEYVSVYLAFVINYNDISNDYYINIDNVVLESVIIQAIFMLLALYIFIYIKKFFKLKKISHIFILVPILINISTLILSFRLIAVDNSITHINDLILILIPLLVLISNIYFFLIVKRSIRSYKFEYENEILKDNILKEYNYYLNMSKEKEKIRNLHHDMKNHIICIRHLCESNELEKIITYIDDIESKTCNYSKYKDALNTGNMILDSILINKKSICENKEINFNIDMDFSKSDFIDMIDVCTIFSNLIDNAIEACDKIIDSNLPKNIVLKSKYIDNFCVIIIENTKINKINKKNGAFLTSKIDSSMHGIGLKNAITTVEKYSGNVVITHDDNIFKVKIVIPNT